MTTNKLPTAEEVQISRFKPSAFILRSQVDNKKYCCYAKVSLDYAEILADGCSFEEASEIALKYNQEEALVEVYINAQDEQGEDDGK